MLPDFIPSPGRGICLECGLEQPTNNRGLCRSCEADLRDEEDVQRGYKDHPED